MMVCLLLYASCVGVFASRKIAQAGERTLAFLAIVGADRPDFRTISDVRTRPLTAFCDVFVAGLCIAGEAGGVERGEGVTRGGAPPRPASPHKNTSACSLEREKC